jgi:hypothetical protein
MYPSLRITPYFTSRTNNLGSRLEYPQPRAYTRRIQNFGSPSHDAQRLATHVPGKSFPIPIHCPPASPPAFLAGSPTGSATNHRKSNLASRTKIAQGRNSTAREQVFSSPSRAWEFSRRVSVQRGDGNKLGISRIGEAGSRSPRFVRIAAGICGGGSRRRMACLEWGDLRC